MSPHRPLHLRGTAIGLVVLGGAVGTLLRYLLSLVIPSWQGMPLGIFVVNVSGAFVLGWLLEALSRSGPDEGRRRTARLLVGTGVLGGYTTYSTFAVDTDGLLLTAQFGPSALYGLATVLVGAAASVAGIAVGAAVARRRGGAR
ncbi:membrane protein [Microbacterium mangrovi]|uniref:Fluoride-specific ion channel FluC n=1 Tax=Microbacterium mangrovi TaxID=1348253 RepID=A0A0B1ZXA5_9MICO|nr:fluoride efflux transporter CrcB [Microbacterium mangrovi]KHK95830.1 membrane protein [Microbacterium mangrovi]